MAEALDALGLARAMHLMAGMATFHCIAWRAIWAFALPVACASAPTPVLQQPVGFTHTEPAAEPVTPSPIRLAKRQNDESTGPTERRQQPLPMVCTLPNTPVSALYFQDDSSTLGRREELILKQVADCLIQGPLEGDRVVVFGYADPRGGVDYNLDLAMARARAVRRYLVRWGVSPCNVSVASRGARYARGTGPESWQVDRRAEIHLDQDPVTVSC